jgi:hypothetical protein
VNSLIVCYVITLSASFCFVLFCFIIRYSIIAITFSGWAEKSSSIICRLWGLSAGSAGYMPCGQSEKNFILYRLPEEPSSITDLIIMSAQRILHQTVYGPHLRFCAINWSPFWEPGGPNIYRIRSYDDRLENI